MPTLTAELSSELDAKRVTTNIAQLEQVEMFIHTWINYSQNLNMKLYQEQGELVEQI
jgi:hypothetical protein